MITADELLNNPKYREMEYRKLRDCLMRMDRYDYEILRVKLRVKLNVTLTGALMEYYKNNPLKPKQMKKDEIKHPMILVLRDGSRNYVIPSIEFGWTASDKNNEHVIGSKYREDLTEKYGLTALDIMQVLDWDGTVLWQREEKRYFVKLVELNGGVSNNLQRISAEKAERIKKIIEEE